MTTTGQARTEPVSTGAGTSGPTSTGQDPPSDVVTLVRRAAERSPGRVVLSFPVSGDTITFAELDERSDRIAQALATLGVAAGDRVAVTLGIF